MEGGEEGFGGWGGKGLEDGEGRVWRVGREGFGGWRRKGLEGGERRVWRVEREGFGGLTGLRKLYIQKVTTLWPCL